MRPHEQLARYLESVESAIAALRSVYVEQYREELLAPIRANLGIVADEANAFYGFRPFPSRGRVVTNETVDCLRDEEGI